MFKRTMLALTFLAAFGAVGVGVTDNAEARRGWGRSYVRYYSPPRDYYYRSYVPYRTNYRDYYGPRYYRTYYGGYPSYYGYPDYNYYGPRSGVSVSFGF